MKPASPLKLSIVAALPAFLGGGIINFVRSFARPALRPVRLRKYGGRSGRNANAHYIPPRTLTRDGRPRPFSKHRDGVVPRRAPKPIPATATRLLPA